MTQLGGGDEAVVVTIEDLLIAVSEAPLHTPRKHQMKRVTNLEGLADFLFRVGVLHLTGHHGKKLYCRTCY